jgi:hypothetical protein
MRYKSYDTCVCSRLTSIQLGPSMFRKHGRLRVYPAPTAQPGTGNLKGDHYSLDPLGSSLSMECVQVIARQAEAGGHQIEAEHPPVDNAKTRVQSWYEWVESLLSIPNSKSLRLKPHPASADSYLTQIWSPGAIANVQALMGLQVAQHGGINCCPKVNTYSVGIMPEFKEIHTRQYTLSSHMWTLSNRRAVMREHSLYK